MIIRSLKSQLNGDTDSGLLHPLMQKSQVTAAKTVRPGRDRNFHNVFYLFHFPDIRAECLKWEVGIGIILKIGNEFLCVCLLYTSQTAADICEFPKPLQNLVVGYGRLSILIIDAHLLPIRQVSPNRRINRP